MAFPWQCPHTPISWLRSEPASWEKPFFSNILLCPHGILDELPQGHTLLRERPVLRKLSKVNKSKFHGFCSGAQFWPKFRCPREASPQAEDVSAGPVWGLQSVPMWTVEVAWTGLTKGRLHICPPSHPGSFTAQGGGARETERQRAGKTERKSGRGSRVGTTGMAGRPMRSNSGIFCVC